MITYRIATILFLATAFAAGTASAAEGLSFGGVGLNPPKTSVPGQAATDTTEKANLQADDDSYKRICDVFGEGFVYSANGICIKIGGYIKFGTSFGGGSLNRR